MISCPDKSSYHLGREGVTFIVRSRNVTRRMNPRKQGAFPLKKNPPLGFVESKFFCFSTEGSFSERIHVRAVIRPRKRRSERKTRACPETSTVGGRPGRGGGNRPRVSVGRLDTGRKWGNRPGCRGHSYADGRARQSAGRVRVQLTAASRPVNAT